MRPALRTSPSLISVLVDSSMASESCSRVFYWWLRDREGKTSVNISLFLRFLPHSLMAHMVYIKQMWEQHHRIILVVGSDSLDGSPPKHNSCCVCTSVFTSLQHTHVSKTHSLSFLALCLVLLFIHPMSWHDGSAPEVLPADELNFSDFSRNISADSDVKGEKEQCFVRLSGSSESCCGVVFFLLHSVWNYAFLFFSFSK